MSRWVAWVIAVAVVAGVADPLSLHAQPAATALEPIVCRPTGTEASAPHPMIIWNHGRAHSAAEYKLIQAGWRRSCDATAATLNVIFYIPVRPDLHGPANIPAELALVMGAIDEAKALPDVDPARIALMGHSRGGLLAMMAAVRRNDLAAVIVTAVPDISPHGRDTVRLLPHLSAPVLLMVEKGDDEGGLDGFGLFSRALKSAGKEHRAILFDRGGGHSLFQRRDYWWDDFVPFLEEKVRITPSPDWRSNEPINRKKIELPPPDPARRKR